MCNVKKNIMLFICYDSITIAVEVDYCTNYSSTSAISNALMLQLKSNTNAIVYYNTVIVKYQILTELENDYSNNNVTAIFYRVANRTFVDN